MSKPYVFYPLSVQTTSLAVKIRTNTLIHIISNFSGSLQITFGINMWMLFKIGFNVSMDVSF